MLWQFVQVTLRLGRWPVRSLSTRSTAVGPQSSEANSSDTNTRNNRGSNISGSRIFHASNVDSHTTQNVCSTLVISESILSHQSIAENIATFKYVKVSIDGVDNNLDALNDNGSQINLIHRSIIPDDKMQTVGRITIRGAFGAPVQTDVTLLSIKPAVSDINEVNIAPPLEIMFAVCDKLKERIILTSDTVNNLELLQHYNVVHIPESVIAMTSTVDDEIGDDQSASCDDDVIALDGGSESLVSTVQDTFVDRRVTLSNQLDVDPQLRSADYITLLNEQITDPSLNKYWDMARDNQKNGFFVQDGLLYPHGQVNGEKVTQLCLPSQRISTVLKIAHDMPFRSLMAFRRANDRIAMSFFFAGQRYQVKDYCMRCETCQLFAPARRNDFNVIKPIPCTRCASFWSSCIRLFWTIQWIWSLQI